MDKKYPPRLHAVGKSPFEKKAFNHNVHLANFSLVKDCIGEDAWNAVKATKIGFFQQLHGSDYVWGTNTVRYLLANQLLVKKEHEIWCLVGGQPIRFSLYEFGEITGLNIDPLPKEECANKHDDFWNELGLEKHMQEGPTYDELKQVLCKCRSWSFEKRKLVGLLCTLHVGVYGFSHNVRLPLQTSRRIFRDEDIDSYPWGRVAFESLIRSIKTAHINGDHKSITLPGFVHAILFWSFESVKVFGERFGNLKDETALPLLKWRGSRLRCSIPELLSEEIEKHGEVRVRKMIEFPESEIYPEWDSNVEDEELDNLIHDILRGDFVKGYWGTGIDIKKNIKNKSEVKRVDGGGKPHESQKKQKMKEKHEDFSLDEEEVAKKKKLDADGAKSDSMIITTVGMEVQRSEVQAVGFNASITTLVKLVEGLHARLGEVETNVSVGVREGLRKEMEAFGDERYGRRIDHFEQKLDVLETRFEDRMSKYEGDVKLIKNLLTGREALDEDDKLSKAGDRQLSSLSWLIRGAKKDETAGHGGRGKFFCNEVESPLKGGSKPQNGGVGNLTLEEIAETVGKDGLANNKEEVFETPKGGYPVSAGHDGEVGKISSEEIAETGGKGGLPNNKNEEVFVTPKKGVIQDASTAGKFAKGKQQKGEEGGQSHKRPRVVIQIPCLLDKSVSELDREEKEGAHEGDDDDDLVDVTEEVRLQEERLLLGGSSPDEYDNSDDRQVWEKNGKAIDACYMAIKALDGGNNVNKKKMPSKPPFPHINWSSGETHMVKHIAGSPYIYDPWGPAAEERRRKVEKLLELHKEVPLGKGVEEYEFYRELVTPREQWPHGRYGWLRETHMAAYLNVLRGRSLRENSPFHTRRIAFLDPYFVSHWLTDWDQFKTKPANFNFREDYKSVVEGRQPAHQKTHMKWYVDVDYLYFAHNVNGNHWVACEVVFKKNKVYVYDSILNGVDSEENKKYLPFMRMIPYMLSAMIPERKKAYAQMSVCRRRRVPQNENPGDCGVYTLKFIECLALGVKFTPEILNDSKIPEIRWRMAADILEESPGLYDQFIAEA